MQRKSPSGRQAATIRNTIRWRERLDRLQGVPVQYDLRPYDSLLEAINDREAAFASLSDAVLRSRLQQLRRGQPGAARGAAIDRRSEVFAAVRVAARRTIGLRPFDHQVLAAIGLDEGHIVEMQTGEGKTLAAVMPAALNALGGQGVHILTFNDYLARRDAEWMGPIYRALGLSVAFVQQGMSRAERQLAYGADVTYVTAKEAGFDYLRDNLVMHSGEVVHRPFHYAIVDEADSLLIDEARVPLVIAGSFGEEPSRARMLARLVESLEPGVHFETDEFGRDVELTEAGIEYVERVLGCGSLHEAPNYQWLTEVNCALHARVLLRRDVDYLVREGRIQVIDEFTGRVVTDRQWPDGLQAALEAKEHLEQGAHGHILGSVTLQHFLRRYTRLSGMTGTARGAAREFQSFYGLGVLVVPPHRPVLRRDEPDAIFATRCQKERAVVAEVARARAAGRPVLVGTQTVEESERLAATLSDAGVVDVRVLNARNDAAEAEIVAQAGAVGAVTISTNMAGRGTDIRLGGHDQAERDRVVELGGLLVIGTNRHESRRVDLQLRGRAGRQGDPGTTRFFLSLEDDLLVRHGLQDLLPRRFDIAPDGAIDDLVVRQRVAQAQRVVEGRCFSLRQVLYHYACIVEEQRETLTARRLAVLTGAETRGGWDGPTGRRRDLVEASSEEAVRELERAVTLHCLDEGWRDHLARVADLREGIHLVELAGQDPLTRFAVETRQGFEVMTREAEARAQELLLKARPGRSGLELEGASIRRPASTWTYLVQDPFTNQMARLLTGPGGKSVAIYAAVMMMPLLLVWGIVSRWIKKGLGTRVGVRGPGARGGRQ